MSNTERQALINTSLSMLNNAQSNDAVVGNQFYFLHNDIGDYAFKFVNITTDVKFHTFSLSGYMAGPNNTQVEASFQFNGYENAVLTVDGQATVYGLSVVGGVNNDAGEQGGVVANIGPLSGAVMQDGSGNNTASVGLDLAIIGTKMSFFSKDGEAQGFLSEAGLQVGKLGGWKIGLGQKYVDYIFDVEDKYWGTPEIGGFLSSVDDIYFDLMDKFVDVSISENQFYKMISANMQYGNMVNNSSEIEAAGIVVHELLTGQRLEGTTLYADASDVISLIQNVKSQKQADGSLDGFNGYFINANSQTAQDNENIKPFELTEEELKKAIEAGGVNNTPDAKVSESKKAVVEIEKEDGTIEEFVIAPAEWKIETTEAEVQSFIIDLETGGIVISDVTDTVEMFGTTFDRHVKTVEAPDGSRSIETSEVELPIDGAMSSNGVTRMFMRTIRDENGDIVKQINSTKFIDSQGNEHITTETRIEGGQTLVQETITGTDGVVSQSPAYIVPDTELINTIQFLGSTAGSLLANHLSEGDVLQSIAYKAILNTITDHFGSFTGYLASGGTFEDALKYARGVDIDNPVAGTLLDTPEISETFFKHLSSYSAGALANVIVDEVGETLGIDGTIGGEVFNTVAGTVTTGVLQETFGILFNNMPAGAYSSLAGSGFDFSAPFFDPALEPNYNPNMQGPYQPNTTVGDFVQAQVVNALAAYAGARLAGEVIEAESETAALFGSFGSALGSAIGAGSIGLSTMQSILSASFVGGPIGIMIGAFIGTLAGTALGNSFGREDHPSSVAHVDYNPATGLYGLDGVWSNDGGPQELSQSMAESVIQGINDILGATGGALRHTSAPPEVNIGWKEGTFFVNVIDGETREFGSAADASAYAALHILKNFDLVGGHAVVMRAWHNTEAATISEWQDDIEVAEAFQNYLLNPNGILALMMDQPDSDAAQAWAAILQRAAELELHLPHEKDLDGGWNELLLARGDIDPSLIPDIDGDSIVLTDPITGEQTTLHHVIGPGYEIVRIEGTDGNDIIEVVVDGPSIAYVDAGAGDDIVEGSDERDIILGGAGDDEINGNGGDDWINGGSGEDTIHGNGGLDLIYGGDDNDTLFGDEDGDAVYGGLGDDIMDGLAGDDELFGGQGNDTLDGGDGTDLLNGEAGDDILTGRAGDTLIGGAGDDTYNMIDGQGRISISRGDGHDVISGSALLNYIRFDQTISINELWFEASGNDLLIKILGEDQSIRVEDLFNTADPSKFIIEITNQLRLYGNQGEHGQDTYLWEEAHLNAEQTVLGTWDAPTGQYNYISDASLADKHNAYQSWIDQGTLDSWMLDIIDPNAWQNMSVADYKIMGSEQADSYNITAGGNYSNGLIFMGGGSDTVSVQHAYTHLTADFAYGDSGDDVLDGGYGNDTIVGGLGNDDLGGYRGNDLIYGGYGDDVITGGVGDDVLYGGAGNDTIEGTYHDDTLYGGDGNDILNDLDGNNALYGEEGDDVITITGLSNNILDGGAGNDTITAYDGDDTLSGGDGDDILDGAGGNDVLNGGSGADRLIYALSGNTDSKDAYDGGADVDTLVLNLTAAQFAQGDIQRDLLRIKGHLAQAQSGEIFYFTAFALAVLNIEQLEINVDGVIEDISYTMTSGTSAADVITGTALHDNISGDDGDDDIAGAAGHDLLKGGLGNDTIVGDDGFDEISGGDGNDTLSGGTGGDDISGDAGNDVISGDSGNDTLYGGDGVDDISGGTESDLLAGGNGNDSLDGGDGNDVLYGDSGNDTLNGDAGDDTLEGGSGDDVLTGGVGDDILKGGIGNDEYIYAIGDGSDTIEDSSGTDDFIRFSAGIVQSGLAFTSTEDNALEIAVGSDPNDTITILNNGTADNPVQISVEKLIFEDLSEINLIGSLAASATDDAADVIQSDSVIIDVLTNDNVLNGASLKVSEISQASHGSVLLNANGTITYTASSGYVGIDSFTYTAVDWSGQSSTGTVTVSVLPAPLPEIHGSASAEYLYGTSDSEALYSYGGNDRIYAYEGDDILDGGTGSDILIGGKGDDTYNWTTTQNSIIMFDDDTGSDLGYDVIKIHGVTMDEVRLQSWNGNEDLMISCNDCSNTLRVAYQYYTETRGGAFDSRKIEKVVFDDGSEVILEKGITFTYIGTDSNDTIKSYGSSDTIIGGAGNDTLYGQGGADKFVFDDLVSSDNVQDFNLSEGDKLDITDLLAGYDPLTDAITDFVQITDDGTNSTLAVDADGGADSFVTVATLYNAIGLTDEDALETSGNLIAA